MEKAFLLVIVCTMLEGTTKSVMADSGPCPSEPWQFASRSNPFAHLAVSPILTDRTARYRHCGPFRFFSHSLQRVGHSTLDPVQSPDREDRWYSRSRGCVRQLLVVGE